MDHTATDPYEGLSDTLIGVRVGPYRLRRRLGQGGMGVVYEAVHEGIGQRAAVKVLPASAGGDPRAAWRLLNEARALVRLSHDGLVKVFDCGYLPEGSPYVLMEYLDGETLGARLARLCAAGQRLDLAVTLHLARQVVAALQVARRLGVVHRDLKPDNIFLVPDAVAPGGARAKLLDFGLAKLVTQSAAEHQTAEGAVMGTPAYMSPEQCAGRADVDHRADVYSLGVVLYELIAGRRPFIASTRVALMSQHLLTPPPPLRQAAPEAPAALHELVHGMLAKEPAMRPDLDTVAAQLAGLMAPGSPSVRPSRRWRRALLALAPLLLCGLVAALLRWPPRREVRDRRGQPRQPPPGMVSLEGGTFLMGSDPEESRAAYEYCRSIPHNHCRADIYEREGPRHAVEVSPFFLDETEVTNLQFANWLNERSDTLRPDASTVRERGGPSLLDLADARGGIRQRDGQFSPSPGFEDRPVVLVTWDGALRYCRAYGKRLPTEAEWELAARGCTRRRFPWGEDPPRCEGVVFGRTASGQCAQSGEAGPRPVGSAPQDRTPVAGGASVADLGGNVAEWVMDRFLLAQRRYPECPPPCRDPLVDDGSSAFRVVRGGSFYQASHACLAAGRSRARQDEMLFNVGFRCAAPAGP